MKQSKKAKAFELFSQGYVPLDEEVKALGLHQSNRYKYFSEWKRLGKPAETETHHSQPVMVSSKSSSGEAIGVIDETKAKPKPAEVLSQEEPMPEGVEDESEDLEPEEAKSEKPQSPEEGVVTVDETRLKGKKKEEEGKGERGKFEITVADPGIKCTIFLSKATLALHELAAAKHKTLSKNGEGKLLLGDFLDDCVEIYFLDRNLKLGLVEL